MAYALKPIQQNVWPSYHLSTNLHSRALMWLIERCLQDWNFHLYRGSPDSTNFAPPGNRTIEKIVLSGVWFSTKMPIYAFGPFKVHFFAHFHKFKSSLQNEFSKKTMTWSLSDNFIVQSLSTVDNFLNFGPDIAGFWIDSTESWQYLKQLYWKNCQVLFFLAKKNLENRTIPGFCNI